jgi:hypothetical protein
VDELCRLSPEFEAMWRDNDVRGYGGEVKHLRHPIAGPIAFEYSAFAVDGRPNLRMVVYNPATTDGRRADQIAHEAEDCGLERGRKHCRQPSCPNGLGARPQGQAKRQEHQPAFGKTAASASVSVLGLSGLRR